MFRDLEGTHQPIKGYSMAYSRQRDFMFCNFCGTMLCMSSNKYAECPLCKSKRKLKDIAEKEICYAVSAEDIRRELNIEPFVKLDGLITEESEAQNAKTKGRCDRCEEDTWLYYYTRQLRSADEGQTIFYECTKCGLKWSQNT